MDYLLNMADFFSNNKREIEAYSKWLDETLTKDSGRTDSVRDLFVVSEGHYFKSKLISKVLNELASSSYGELIPQAINNLGENFLKIIRADRVKDPDKIEVDIDTIMNFLGQAAQEIQLRNDASPSVALSEVLDYFFYSKHRTDTEKVISVYLTGKLPLLVYASRIHQEKDSFAKQLKETETKVLNWNERLNN